jgi:hypothetical protein
VGSTDRPVALLAEVRQFAEPGEGGGDRGEDPQPDEGLGARCGVLAPQEVEGQGARERADRQVGQDRVGGVAQPGAGEEVLDGTGLEDLADRSADGLPDAVEPLVPADAPYERLHRFWHEPFLPGFRN